MKNPRLLPSIVVSLLIAALSYFWGTALMDSLYAFRSPLHDNPPQAGKSLGEPLTRRVVLVLIDALRYDTSTNAEVMPFLKNSASRAPRPPCTASRRPTPRLVTRC